MGPCDASHASLLLRPAATRCIRRSLRAMKAKASVILWKCDAETGRLEPSRTKSTSSPSCQPDPDHRGTGAGHPLEAGGQQRRYGQEGGERHGQDAECHANGDAFCSPDRALLLLTQLTRRAHASPRWSSSRGWLHVRLCRWCGADVQGVGWLTPNRRAPSRPASDDAGQGDDPAHRELSGGWCRPFGGVGRPRAGGVAMWPQGRRYVSAPTASVGAGLPWGRDRAAEPMLSGEATRCFGVARALRQAEL